MQNQRIYEELDPDVDIEWIPSNFREEFIRQYRLKTNMEIKLTQGIDLFKERMNNWANSDPALKEKYEKLKKDAQIEEFKFMEKIMSEFGYQNYDT